MLKNLISSVSKIRRSLKIFSILFALGLSISLLISACTANNSILPSTGNSPAAKAIRIGYQKSSELAILKAKGDFEKRLKEQGTSVTWNLFTAGPPLLEALNAGSIDFGGTGELPPIFAQAAGAKLTYVASTVRNPETQALIVPNNSPIQKIEDLKGKKIAFQKGSSAHYQLIKVLEAANLKYTDIRPVPLAPPDARVAFEQGNVDAWVIWDPFLAAAESSEGVRILKQGQERRTFMLSSQAFSKAQPEVIKVILEELKNLDDWAIQKPQEVAAVLAPDLGLDVKIVEKVVRRQGWTLESIDTSIVESQQKIADLFLQLKLIPKPVDIKESVLTPDEYAKFAVK